MKKLLLYTLPTCSHCHELKAFLKAKHVTYTEYDVMADKSKAQEMIDRTHQTAVPVLMHEPKEGEEPEFMVGFAPDMVEEIEAFIAE